MSSTKNELSTFWKKMTMINRQNVGITVGITGRTCALCEAVYKNITSAVQSYCWEPVYPLRHPWTVPYILFNRDVMIFCNSAQIMAILILKLIRTSTFFRYLKIAHQKSAGRVSIALISKCVIVFQTSLWLFHLYKISIWKFLNTSNIKASGLVSDYVMFLFQEIKYLCCIIKS